MSRPNCNLGLRRGEKRNLANCSYMNDIHLACMCTDDITTEITALNMKHKLEIPRSCCYAECTVCRHDEAAFSVARVS